MNRVLFVLALGMAAVGAAALASPARAADTLYEITKKEPRLAVGSTATASMTVKVKGGWHVNGEAPINLALTPPDGMSVKKTKLTRADLAESTIDTLRFDIPITATVAGKKIIPAEARFVICQESACKPIKETLAFAIEVAPPPAAAKKRANH
jgi:hypothetical protein